MRTLSPLRFFNFLKERGLTCAVAESCTGGLFAHEITKFPGASRVFWGGVVSYTESSKTKLLGVSKETLEQYGSVSAPVAQAMAEGLAKVSGADLVLAVTGLAGPTVLGDVLRVGTVWLAVTGRWKSKTLLCQFQGNRRQIRAQSSGMGRLFAVTWWESKGELDIEGFIADNSGKPFVKLHPSVQNK